MHEADLESISDKKPYPKMLGTLNVGLSLRPTPRFASMELFTLGNQKYYFQKMLVTLSVGLSLRPTPRFASMELFTRGNHNNPGVKDYPIIDTPDLKDYIFIYTTPSIDTPDLNN